MPQDVGLAEVVLFMMFQNLLMVVIDIEAIDPSHRLFLTIFSACLSTYHRYIKANWERPA